MNLPPSISKPETWPLRLAQESDVPALEELIPQSVRALQAAGYSKAQMDAALGPVFGVDHQIIRDGTYFVAEKDGSIVGCGGWSRRRSLYGGHGVNEQEDGLLDPQKDAARVRAFFVHPAWARHGIGRSIMAASEQAIIEAGFSQVDIVATLVGEPLYASFGYAVVERCEIALPGGLALPVVRMTKTMTTPPMPEGFMTPPEALSFDKVRLHFIKMIPGDPSSGLVPAYHFHILISDGSEVGHINFRLGDTEHVLVSAGHIGYKVLEPFRGHGYALQACRAIAPFVRTFYDTVTITCDPDNHASIRTIERLGASFTDEVPVPPHDPHFQRGARRKKRYRWKL